ncbi:MAG: sulfatase-like hydrolase/transferase [Rhodothermaceae bacterium]|nr:sulfatase-like hydrolase/transferase [Rhodothermaceae bacterium]
MRALYLFLILNLVTVFAYAQRPNIVLILADDLGYGDLSSYGAEDLKTPHIDALVEGGMRFDQFYANSPVCSPTRASLLSGRYPQMVGVPGVIRTRDSDNWGHLSRDAVLLPAMLKRGGYHTALIGKWHLGLEAPNRPTERGFDLFHGFLGDMMDDYYEHRRHGINYMRYNTDAIRPEGHATDLFTDWSIDYIEDRAESSAPFFLFLSYNAPHTPIQPPEEWVEQVTDREPGISEQRARLVALIEHMDDGIGKVIQALKDTEAYENTILIFTSDNGGQLNVGANNGALRDGKQSMYEGGLKVPTAMIWEGKINPGSRTDHMALSMDLFPTLVEAAGLSVTHFIEGKSFFSILTGQMQFSEPRDFFFSRREGGTRYSGKTIEAIRRGDWKLLQNSPFASLELYNLRDDPLEQNNLMDEAREIYQELERALREHIRLSGQVAWQRP